MWVVICGVLIMAVALWISSKQNNKRDDGQGQQTHHSHRMGEKKDSGRCDGDCNHCPAHYGYRHGRWYYGHGHQHGCERHGNGGASGRTCRN